MFNSIWRRFIPSQSRKTPAKRLPNRTLLCVEMLEDRVTPTTTATITGAGSTLTLTTSGTDLLTITSTGFQQFDIADSGALINGGSSFTTPLASPVTAMVINLGAGSDSLAFAGTSGAPINLTGPTVLNTLHQLVQTTGTDLIITGTGGNKTITATDLFLPHQAAGLTMTLTGLGTASTTFTDSNITGAATINESLTTNVAGHGNTFTINTINATVNTWGSLTLTNGTGADVNDITDTNFTGNVTISNGAGSGTGANGGSLNLFSDGNYHNLLTVGGNLTISTTTGQSDTEVNDYNVHGALTITGGAGITGQTLGNVVGIENNQTLAGAGVPTFGSISISAGSVAAGLTIDVGANAADTLDFPLTVATTLSISATGAGSVDMTLDGLSVGGTATLSTAATTSNDAIDVFGDNTITSYGALTINASGSGANRVDLQQQPGTLNVLGALGVNFGAGKDSLLVGSAGTPGSAGPPIVPATPPGTVTTGGAFGVTGAGGAKTVTVVGAAFGSMIWALTGIDSGTGIFAGANAESALFTDTNVAGAATISNTVVGKTSFTIQTSANNANLLNTWGSLSITNGAGSDINNISDTDFTGSVTINNGAGATGNTGAAGGSQTKFGDDTNTPPLNPDQLTIAGNLTITTTSGNSITEIQDYSIHGNVTLGAGAGVAGQASIVSLEGGQTVGPIPTGGATGTTSGIPLIGGSVSITGSPVVSSTLTVVVGAGIGVAGHTSGDFPLIIGNGVNAAITGAGSAAVTLNDLTVSGNSNISLGATTINDTVTVKEGNGVPTSFGALTIGADGSVGGANTVNLESQAGTLNVVGALVVGLGAGADNVNIGSASSNVHVSGAFTITASVADSNAITINALDDTFGALNWVLSGKGTETALFTDTNVAGTATINTGSLTGAIGTTGVGAQPTTSLTIDTSAANSAALNTWGGLTVANGTGSDINSITDTDFTGNVSIANGAGATNDTGPFGGSENIFSDGRNLDLLSIHGTLSITTTTGQSDTEVYDYNVHGSVALGAGAGFTTQSNANVIGLEDNQTVAGSGIPVIGGSVTITGGTVTGPTLSPLPVGLIINLGTDSAHNYPLIIQGNLAITTSGTGAADLDLNDLSVATGTTTITLASTNQNDSVQVQGSTAFTSVYDSFTLNSAATGTTSTYSLQDAAGNLQFTGMVAVTLGSGADTLNVGADSANTSGVAGALIDFWAITTFNGGAGTDALFEGARGTNLFYLNTPTILSFP